MNFSILITTKNRLEDLKYTLQKIHPILIKKDVECIICDDGSVDNTYEFIRTEFPRIRLIRNKKSKGLIYCRNRLLNLTTAKYAISLDDDAHIVTSNSLEIIEQFFNSKPTCAVMAFRIFWGNKLPNNLNHSLEAVRVKSFVGCGHVWRMEAWKDIPNYPDWFIFYGEEDYTSFQLLKKKWEIWFVPDILVHHRVDLKIRKKQKDYMIRLRRSLRSGWYLYFLFYPWSEIPKKFIYTLWMQLKLKVFKGDLRATFPILLALIDVIITLPKLMYYSKRLTKQEYLSYNKIKETQIYWNPKEV